MVLHSLFILVYFRNPLQPVSRVRFHNLFVAGRLPGARVGARSLFPRFLFAVLLAAFTCPAVFGITIRVDNPVGNISVRVANVEKVQLRHSSPVRGLREGDISIERQPGLLLITAHPGDSAEIDIEVVLPYGVRFQGRTTTGSISLEGLLPSAGLITGTGNLLLSAPWKATRFEFTSRAKPPALSLPGIIKFSQHRTKGKDGVRHWLLRDKNPASRITYSWIQVRADAPRKLVLREFPIPDDAPIKLPWQASAIVAELLARSPGRSSRKRVRRHAAPAGEGAKPVEVENGRPVFVSSVRMVNLTVAVFDRNGHAITDLKPEDFEVFEDGRRQKVEFAGSEQVPFNLVLLLDLSGSTRRDRPAMKEAAIRFIGIARKQDRVAVYALANNVFHVISPLTRDRERLRKLVENIPQVSGGTPLYDTIVLAYAQELRRLTAERNALIVISDGVDNRIHQIGAASEVSFKKLREAAKKMNVLIYPIFLDPFTLVPPPDWARKARRNMQALADATGGRLFVARSVRDLEPVYPLVANELRSVYTLTYYPSNQNFDGSWRRVKVRVKRPGARVRTRSGYFAR